MRRPLNATLRALRERGHRGPIELTVVDYFVDERANPDVRFLDVNDFAALGERFESALVEYRSGEEFRLEEGSHLNIPAGTAHRVAWTAPDTETVWLAVHYG